MAEVLPIADNIGWVKREGDTGPHAGILARLGDLVTKELNADLERTPEWDAIQQLVEEGAAFDRDGRPTRRMRVQVEAAKRRGVAMFKKSARELRPVISLLAGQNAQPTEDPPQPPPQGRSGDEKGQAGGAAAQQQRQQGDDELAGLSTEERLELLYQRQQARARDAEAPVGTLRR